MAPRTNCTLSAVAPAATSHEMPRWTALLTLLSLSACGSPPPPEPPHQEEAPAHARRSGPVPDVSAEIGALDEAAVTRAFNASLDGLSTCLAEGARRVEPLGGNVAFFVRVDATGAVAHAHLESSTLGDRATEQCMLRAIAAQRWPKPQGGQAGLARKSFEFDPVNDGRPPTTWSPDRVAQTLAQAADTIAQCKQAVSGSFEATVYVDTDGKPLGVGVTPPDEAGDAATDCLVEALRALSYPSPGSWPAKVTFPL